MDKVSGTFLLFLADGTPVRAKLNVSFKEYIEVSVLVRANPTQSADHRKSRTVQLGDTISNIAFEEYGDPQKWRPIAEANDLDNPLKLIPGHMLFIPALDAEGNIR
jgi:nucleoid-associated protein YgaU